MRKALLIAVLLALPTLTAFASETSGIVNSSHNFGWGENMGWVNFAPSSGGLYNGLVVTDTAVTGFAWSSAVGWINFSPTNSRQGVSNTTDGHLGGYAWVAALGWLPMDGVTINSSGTFKGTAGTAGTEGSEVGRVSFDCDKCSVVTDWRPASARTPATPLPPVSHGGGVVSGPLSIGFGLITNSAPPVQPQESGPLASPTAGTNASPTAPVSVSDAITSFFNGINVSAPVLRTEPTHVESYNTPLTISPVQSGLLVQNNAGGVGTAVEIPQGAAAESITVSITTQPEPPGTYGTSLQIMGGSVFDIEARTSAGVLVHTFAKPLKITLVIPEPLQGGSDTGVYWFDPATANWVAVSDVAFSGRTASFYVSHLTRFAVLGGHITSFQATSSSAILSSKGDVLGGWLLLLALVVVLYIAYRRHKRLNKEL